MVINQGDTDMMNLINEIAADTIANSANKHGYTVETLVANWVSRNEWLGRKVGGKAWFRDLLASAKYGWVATTQKTSVFIPPSEETLAWGGFLGGEWVNPQHMKDDAEAAFYARFPTAR
jgi:hypothetical protein